MERLDLRDVILVGNDTGGAICQIVVAEHPERIGSSPTATPTNPFPALLSPFHYAAASRYVRFVNLLALVLRTRVAQRALFKTVATAL
jgi:pimeloyl-ACP methyl ester carboxylesterase